MKRFVRRTKVVLKLEKSIIRMVDVATSFVTSNSVIKNRFFMLGVIHRLSPG